MVKDCPRLSKIVRDGQRLSEVVKDCQRWSEIVRGGQRLSEVVKDCQRCPEIVRGGNIVLELNPIPQSIFEDPKCLWTKHFFVFKILSDPIFFGPNFLGP